MTIARRVPTTRDNWINWVQGELTKRGLSLRTISGQSKFGEAYFSKVLQGGGRNLLVENAIVKAVDLPEEGQQVLFPKRDGK